MAGGKPPEAPSDVFSLASTLYAATEGEPPFGLSENTLGVLHAVAAGRINPPRRSGALTGVLVAMLNADPLRRPNTAQTRALLEDVANGHMPDVSRYAMADQATHLVDPMSDQTQVIHTRQGSVPRTQRVGPPPMGPPTAMTGRARAVDRPQEPPRSRGPLVAAGIVVVALLAVGVWLMTNRDNETPQQGPAGADTSQQLPTTDDATPTTEVTQTVAPPPVTHHRPTTTTTTTTETTTTDTTTTTTDTTTTETTTTTSDSEQPST